MSPQVGLFVTKVRQALWRFTGAVGHEYPPSVEREILLRYGKGERPEAVARSIARVHWPERLAEYEKQTVCGACGGTGKYAARPRSGEACPSCKGRGRVGTKL